MRWRLSPRLEILFFLGGGILGVYFLDLAEMVFKISPLGVNPRGEPSPFKNVLFQTIFVPFSLFVLTSSGSLFGAGLILSIFLAMLLGQWQELSRSGNINNWFWIVKSDFPPKTQQIYFAVMSGIFILFTLMFI
ncbi:hypothetical protein HZB97_02110 [Candidatus Gottesmanbacteria bacterium]|nr:hypothetical protein [Candidatus Gottesmanbacteria bacterium]